MGHIVVRPDSRFLWMAYEDESGKLVRKSTGLTREKMDLAKKALSDVEDQVSAAKRAGATGGPLLLRQYATTWLEARRKIGVVSVEDDRAHLDLHVLPSLGAMRLDEIRARHLIELFASIQVKKVDKGNDKKVRISPKTVRNIYGTLATLLKDAELEGLIPMRPAALEERHLGRMESRDTMEAADSIYPREHIGRLLAARELPLDRRMFYALEYFGRCRLGEAAALCWGHYDPERQPLGMLRIARSHKRVTSKSGKVRYMPVHPALAAMLAEWRLAWPGIYGKQPTPEDLIVPAIRDPGKGKRLPTGAQRTKSAVGKRFVKDLGLLKLPHRRGHDLGASFITHAEEDGADPVRLSKCTHTGGRAELGAFERYLRRNWGAFCGEVAKLKVSLRPDGAEVVPLPSNTNVSEKTRSSPEHLHGRAGTQTGDGSAAL